MSGVWIQAFQQASNEFPELTMNLTSSNILWTVHPLYSFSVSQAMETQTFSVSALGAMLVGVRFIVFYPSQKQSL